MKLLGFHFASLLVLFSLSAHGQKSSYRNVVRRDLKAHDAVAMAKGLDENFRSFFIEKKGPGKSKSEYIASLGNWDIPLHADFEILSMKVSGNVVTVHVNERNDFAKGIDFPGWKATIKYTINE